MSSMPRELLKWVLSLDLSYPVKNVKRDFSNGFLFAEILSRYFPGEVHMHSFENVTSMDRKKANWKLIQKTVQRKGIPIDQNVIDAIMNAEDDAATEALQSLYRFLNSNQCREWQDLSEMGFDDARNRGSEASVSGYSPQPCYIPAPHDPLKLDQRHMNAEPLSYYGQAAPNQAAFSGMWDSSQQQAAALYTQQMSVYMAQQQLQQQHMLLEMQHQRQPQYQLPGLGKNAGQSYDAEGLDLGVSMLPRVQQGGVVVPDKRGLAFSRKPRAVDYKPYGLKDLAEKNFDVKKSPYWQLGRLGPDLETEELQAKRERMERMKDLAAQINASNIQRLAAAKPRPAPPKKPTARDRALEFARNVPRPEVAPQQHKQDVRKCNGATSGASSASQSENEPGEADRGLHHHQQQQILNTLHQRHEEDQQRVDAIRRELQDMLP